MEVRKLSSFPVRSDNLLHLPAQCWKITLRHVSLSLSRRPCAIWDNTTRVDIHAPHNNVTGLKYTNGSMQFGTRLKCSKDLWVKGCVARASSQLDKSSKIG